MGSKNDQLAHILENIGDLNIECIRTLLGNSYFPGEYSTKEAPIILSAIQVILSAYNYAENKQIFIRINPGDLFYAFNKVYVSERVFAQNEDGHIVTPIEIFMGLAYICDSNAYVNFGDSYFLSAAFIESCNIMIDKSRELSSRKNEENTKTYLMLDCSTGLYKIGRSSDPLGRERTLQSEKPTIKLIAICPSNIETELHRKYADQRIRGEWFALTDEDVAKIEKRFKLNC